MPDWSRRQTLSALAGGLAVSLAGCRGNDDESLSSGGRFPAERRVEEYEVRQVRNDDGVALLTRGDDVESARPGAYDHLQSREDLEAYTFADLPEARKLREFCTATEFESNSVYLWVRRVPECYDLRLQRVGVDANGPSAHFCRDLRPVDASCDADARDTVGYAIRLPFAGDEYSGMGSGMSSSCSRPPRPTAFDANVTVSTERDGR